MPFAIKQSEHSQQPGVTVYDVVEGTMRHCQGTILRFVPADDGHLFRPLGDKEYASKAEAWDKLEHFLMLRAGRLRMQLMYIDSLREVIRGALAKGTTP